MSEPAIPVAVIGGYLGAGKTTLVNGLLRRAEGKRIAVLVNDFGDINIDADLIEARDDDLLALAGGCVCCSFGSDLMRALERMRGLTPRPDCILIETSGVGLPGAVAASVGLLAGLQVANVAVMIDAGAIRQQVDDRYVGDTVVEQMDQARCLLLSKSEDMSDRSIAPLATWLEQKAPGKPWLRVTHGALALSALLSPALSRDPSREFAHSPLPTSSRFKRRISPPAKARYASVAVACDRRVDIARLCQSLATPELGLARIKAVVRNSLNQWQSVQLAGGQWRIQTASPPKGMAALVAIGPARHLDAPAVRQRIMACFIDDPELGA